MFLSPPILKNKKMKKKNNNLCKNMKKIHDFRVRGTSSWDHFGNYEGDLGFSWPPRSYICSFCKREFRSAQALGGHMNVHRRDRVRLRQSPTASDSGGGKFSPLNPNPSFDSNPSSCPSNFPSCPPPFSSLLTRFPHFTSKFPPLGPLPNEMIKKPKSATKVLFEVERCEKGKGDFKKSDFVRLDLEIGLIGDSKEELDLELRLGYT